MFGFNHALRGLLQMLKTERNFKIHVFAFISVIILGFTLEVSKPDWIILLLVSGFVLTMEIINSAIEQLCNLYSTERNEKIKNIKDISAGAVLIAALFAFVIGLVVFCPYLGF